MTVLFFRFVIMYNSLINYFYPFKMFDILLWKYIYYPEDGIAEKLLLFKIKLFLFTTY